MDQIIQTVEPVRQFAKDSIRLVKRCTKPDKKGMIYLQNSIQKTLELSMTFLSISELRNLKTQGKVIES